MNTLALALGGDGNDILFSTPTVLAGAARLTVPEFFGKTDGRPFAVVQTLPVPSPWGRASPTQRGSMDTPNSFSA